MTVARLLRGLRAPKAQKAAVVLRNRLLAPLSVLTWVIPRSKQVWAFGSWYGTRFADNPKYFFLYCLRAAARDIDCVWLSDRRDLVRRLRDLGLPAHHHLSLKGLWTALHAGVYVFDSRVSDVSPIVGRGAIHVNLWHGFPLKRIERDIEQADHPIRKAQGGTLLQRLGYRLLRPEFCEQYDHLVATSTVAATRFGSAFGLAAERILVTGYPRNDPLLSDDQQVFLIDEYDRTIYQEMADIRETGRRVLLYMPTFRDWNNSSARTIPLDWRMLDDQLGRLGAILYCKLHPVDKGTVPAETVFAHIRFVQSGVDVYPMLCQVDALITDYSSVFYDYLLLDRPVLFYSYDLDEYLERSRSLYEDYRDAIPGPLMKTAESFSTALEALLTDYHGERRAWAQIRASKLRHAHAFIDACASERLFRQLTALYSD